MAPADSLHQRAKALSLHGLCAHIDQVASEPWVPTLLGWEEQERTQRGLCRRIKTSRIGSFRQMADFDWSWPNKIDRDTLEEYFRLDFISQADNLVLLGPNGVGKTMIAKNLCHQAVLRGIPALFTTASALLADLCERHTSYALQQRLRFYARPRSAATFWNCWRTGMAIARRSSPARPPRPTGTSTWETPTTPTPSAIASCTMPIVLC